MRGDAVGAFQPPGDQEQNESELRARWQDGHERTLWANFPFIHKALLGALIIALVLLFILIGGVFAATELAIVSLRPSQVDQIERSGRRGKRTARLVRDPNVFLSAVQVGVTVAGFFSSAFGAATIAPYLSRWLVRQGLVDDVAGPLALVVLTLLIAYTSLVLGELVPKRLAMQRATGFTRVLAPPLGVFALALALGLRGHAINLPDGRVEVLAAGDADALESLAAWLREGPAKAEVEAVERSSAVAADVAEGFRTG